MASNNPNATDTLRHFTSENAAEMGAKGGKAKKGSKHINTWIQELLEDETFEAIVLDSKKGVIDYKGAPVRAILMAQMNMALNSKDEAIKIKAAELLFKHGWSQKQEIDATVKTVSPIMSLEDLNAISGNNSNQES